MAARGSDPVPALMVLGGLLTLGVAAWRFSDKYRYSTADHKRLVDQGVAMAVARREKLGRPLSPQEVLALLDEFRARVKEPMNQMDEKRIWNAARG